MSRSNYDGMLPTLPNEPSTNPLISKGLLIILFAFFGFLLWSMLTEIEAAAIADGKVVVEGKSQSIQHLEGGIVQELYVKEGSHVKKNEPLLKLDPTQHQAKLEILNREHIEHFAKKLRINAELKNRNTLQITKAISAIINDDPRNKIIISAQQAILNANINAFDSQLKILNYKIRQLKEEITSLKSQVVSVTVQSKLIQEEISSYLALQKKQLIEKPKLLALQREQARLLGYKGEFLGKIAKANQQIAEAQSQVLTLKQQNKKQLLDELRETQKQLSHTKEQKYAVEDIIKRMIIRAPKSGVVVGLKKHTIGAVISPGQEILSIVPTQANLTIEAKINPLDVDVVRKGLNARIQLSAYKQRNLPSLIGTVSMISADAFQDEKTGQYYYLAKIDGFQHQLSKHQHIKLYPGMPAQVMIITDSRTPLSYLLSPLLDSINRSFREQ